MAQLPLYSPTDLNHITDCTLKYSFFQQLDAASHDAVGFDEVLYIDETSSSNNLLEMAVLKTIQHLHASGGPFRLNLPSALRALGQYFSELKVQGKGDYVLARQIVANYHRQLKTEWVNVIASNELMTLTIRLRYQTIQAEAIIDRVDKAADGGITGVKFILSPDRTPDDIGLNTIETTILHALIAATYPNRRPVRLKYVQLDHPQTKNIELNEKEFRQNWAKMKARVQAWLDGEILARPGPYCDRCPFQYQGCPLFTAPEIDGDSEEIEPDLS
ncbi:MAG: PD-(D/E)XK nuclease family protein [Chloroflexota bacterium]